jgi:hypothetical protein
MISIILGCYVSLLIMTFWWITGDALLAFIIVGAGINIAHNKGR